jgi:uncharacterized membrane protein YgcG
MELTPEESLFAALVRRAIRDAKESQQRESTPGSGDVAVGRCGGGGKAGGGA